MYKKLNIMKTFEEIFAEAEQHLVECVKAGNFLREKRDSTQAHIMIEGKKFVIWCSPFGAKFYQLYGDSYRFPLSEETKQLLYNVFAIDEKEQKRLDLQRELDNLKKRQAEVEEKLNNIKCNTTEED